MISSLPLERETAVALADFFTAMSDPTRVLIIAMLAERDVEVPVQELAEAVDVTPSAVSHQLRLLRQLRVVKARQQGRQKFYSLDDEHIRQLFLQGLEHVRHG